MLAYFALMDSYNCLLPPLCSEKCRDSLLRVLMKNASLIFLYCYFLNTKNYYLAARAARVARATFATGLAVAVS